MYSPISIFAAFSSKTTSSLSLLYPQYGSNIRDLKLTVHIVLDLTELVRLIYLTHAGHLVGNMNTIFLFALAVLHHISAIPTYR